jgi:hypothetical protein
MPAKEGVLQSVRTIAAIRIRDEMNVDRVMSFDTFRAGGGSDWESAAIGHRAVRSIPNDFGRFEGGR